MQPHMNSHTSLPHTSAFRVQAARATCDSSHLLPFALSCSPQYLQALHPPCLLVTLLCCSSPAPAALAQTFSWKIGVVPSNIFAAMLNDRLVAKGTVLEVLIVFFQVRPGAWGVVAAGRRSGADRVPSGQRCAERCRDAWSFVGIIIRYSTRTAESCSGSICP